MNRVRLDADDRARGNEVPAYLAASRRHVPRKRHRDWGEAAERFFDDGVEVGKAVDQGCWVGGRGRGEFGLKTVLEAFVVREGKSPH